MDLNAQLTTRESQVAEYIAWGAAKKEVADRLNISQRTVDELTRRAFRKIGIQKATELSVWWFCTKLGVSFDLSPLKRGIIGAFLLFVMLPSTLNHNYAGDMMRARRAQSTRTASARGGRRGREDEGDVLTIF